MTNSYKGKFIIQYARYEHKSYIKVLLTCQPWDHCQI